MAPLPRAVAQALGMQFRISLEQRIAGAQAVGAHKTSMLQDVEAGRALELEALVGAGLVIFEWVAHDTSLARPFVVAIHLINTFLLLGAITFTGWWASGGTVG